MKQPKTLQQREKELQSLLSTPEGRTQLETLASRYSAGSRVRSARASVVTYILVHERQQGLIVG
jgi:hypothetical protein